MIQDHQILAFALLWVILITVLAISAPRLK